MLAILPGSKQPRTERSRGRGVRQPSNVPFKEEIALFRFTKKRALALAVVASLALAAGAYAYFTTTGSGTGSATVGTSTAVVLHGTAPTTLYPGTSSVVTFTVDNPSSGHQIVRTIKLDSVETDAAHSTCVMTDYTMDDVAANQDVASGPGKAITATGTLTFNNTAASQDGCKNAPLTLRLSSN
ncbi:MAG TPA: hypothetical protein VNT03_08430 [Baekduia sp.]|nr:hypothetical protein [Baekduia sp.]